MLWFLAKIGSRNTTHSSIGAPVHFAFPDTLNYWLLQLHRLCLPIPILIGAQGGRKTSHRPQYSVTISLSDSVKTEIPEIAAEIAAKTEIPEIAAEIAAKTEIPEIAAEIAAKTEIPDIAMDIAAKTEP